MPLCKSLIRLRLAVLNAVVDFLDHLFRKSFVYCITAPFSLISNIILITSMQCMVGLAKIVNNNVKLRGKTVPLCLYELTFIQFISNEIVAIMCKPFQAIKLARPCTACISGIISS